MLSDDQHTDYFDHDTPEIMETICQQSMISVSGAVAISGINRRVYLGDNSDEETVIFTQEVLRRMSTMIHAVSLNYCLLVCCFHEKNPSPVRNLDKADRLENNLKGRELFIFQLRVDKTLLLGSSH